MLKDQTLNLLAKVIDKHVSLASKVIYLIASQIIDQNKTSMNIWADMQNVLIMLHPQ